MIDWLIEHTFWVSLRNHISRRRLYMIVKSRDGRTLVGSIHLIGLNRVGLGHKFQSSIVGCVRLGPLEPVWACMLSSTSPTTCYKEIWVSLKITLSRTLNLEEFRHGKSMALSTKLVSGRSGWWHILKVSVSAVFCLDILQLYFVGLSFVWHSVYFVQL